MSTTTDRIRQIIVEDLAYPGDPGELAPGFDLIEGGVLDSLSIMELVEHLEAWFDIAIDVDDVTAGQFETIEAIATLVGTKQLA